MEEKNKFACDIDVYVVRPVLRNPGGENPEMYFLIMNDQPWTTTDTVSYFNRSAFNDLSQEEQDELENMAYNAHLQLLASADNDDATLAYDNFSGLDEMSTTDSGLYMTMSLTPENIAQYNLRTHNGGCTPPEHSNHWKNDFLTSGRYQYSYPAFEKFMLTAFRKEGGCVNDPDDRGGYTCYGCASKGLCRGIDFRNISRATVEDLAMEKLYKKYNIDKLPDAFRGYALWGMWGSGAITGIKQFQGALGVPKTGKIDEETIRAAENYNGNFAVAYTKNREQFFRALVAKDPSQKKFLRGWLNGLRLLLPSGCHVVPTNPIYREKSHCFYFQ